MSFGFISVGTRPRQTWNSLPSARHAFWIGRQLVDSTVFIPTPHVPVATRVLLEVDDAEGVDAVDETEARVVHSRPRGSLSARA